MPVPPGGGPDLPERMSWEELEQLPDEIAAQIELWDGLVVWVRRGPLEHQVFTMRLTAALERAAREDMSGTPEHCWRLRWKPMSSWVFRESPTSSRRTFSSCGAYRRPIRMSAAPTWFWPVRCCHQPTGRSISSPRKPGTPHCSRESGPRRMRTASP